MAPKAAGKAPATVNATGSKRKATEAPSSTTPRETPANAAEPSGTTSRRGKTTEQTIKREYSSPLTEALANALDQTGGPGDSSSKRQKRGTSASDAVHDGPSNDAIVEFDTNKLHAYAKMHQRSLNGVLEGLGTLHREVRDVAKRTEKVERLVIARDDEEGHDCNANLDGLATAEDCLAVEDLDHLAMGEDLQEVKETVDDIQDTVGTIHENMIGLWRKVDLMQAKLDYDASLADERWQWLSNQFVELREGMRAAPAVPQFPMYGHPAYAQTAHAPALAPQRRERSLGGLAWF